MSSELRNTGDDSGAPIERSLDIPAKSKRNKRKLKKHRNKSTNALLPVSPPMVVGKQPKEKKPKGSWTIWIKIGEDYDSVPIEVDSSMSVHQFKTLLKSHSDFEELRGVKLHKMRLIVASRNVALKPRLSLKSQIQHDEELEVSYAGTYKVHRSRDNSQHSQSSVMSFHNVDSASVSSTQSQDTTDNNGKENALGALRKEIDLIRNEIKVTQVSNVGSSNPSWNGVDSLKGKVESLSGRIENLNNRIEAKNSEALKEMRYLMSNLQAWVRSNREGNGPGAEPTALKPKLVLGEHEGPVWALAEGNGLLFSASSDKKIKIWDVQTRSLRHELTGHQNIVHAVVFWNNMVITGSDDKTIKFWDINAMKCVKTINDDNIACVLKVSNTLLFAGCYKCVKVWNLLTYTCVKVLNGNHWVRAISISNGYLYMGGHKAIFIWDLANFKCYKTLSCTCGSIYSLVASGHFLYSGTYENTVNVWDLRSFECIRTLPGHTGAVYALAIQGNKLYSGSYDQSIRVWDLSTFQCTYSLMGHTSSVEALIVDRSNGGWLISGSTDNTIKFWRPPKETVNNVIIN